MNKRSKTIIAIIAVALLLLVGWMAYSNLLPAAKEVDFKTFNAYVMNGKEGAEQQEGGLAKDEEGNPVIFVKVVIDNYNYYGFQEGEEAYSYYASGPSLYSSTAVDSLLLQWMEIDGLEIIQFEDPNAGSIWSSLVSVFGVVFVCIIFWVIINQTAGGGSKAFSFGKTKAKVTTNVKVRFSDVAGADEEKESLQEITEFLKTPQKFSSLGARIPKGVLLVGPPGTGKTLFAKAVAGESGVPFFSVSGSDFVEMYVGVGASRVRDLFELAKRNQPCIIFIDEIDAVGRERGAGLGGGSDEREQTLNQILVQMDGFESNEAIIVMAATNRSDVLDPALMRPGRFDRKITVNLPDVKGREAILKVHARNKPLAPDVNFKTVARITSGFSGADLENLLNEAAIFAARAGKRFIENVDIYEAVNTVEMGPQKKSRVVTEADKRCTAYHEAGHAIISQLAPYGETVHEVTIIPRGNAAGYTFTRPETDDMHYSKNKLNDLICMMLGGRVAEELVLKDVSTGASNDLHRISTLARKMVTEWGMSERLGLVSYGEGKPVFIGRQMGGVQEYGDSTAAIIDEEVRSIIETQHARALQILTENRSALDNMARILVERNTIYTEEVLMIVNGATVEEVYKAMDEQDKNNGNPFSRFETSADKKAGVQNTQPQNDAQTSDSANVEKKAHENAASDGASAVAKGDGVSADDQGNQGDSFDNSFEKEENSNENTAENAADNGAESQGEDESVNAQESPEQKEDK